MLWKILLSFFAIFFMESTSADQKFDSCNILTDRGRSTKWHSSDGKMNALLHYEKGPGISGGFGYKNDNAPLIDSICFNGTLLFRWNTPGFVGDLKGHIHPTRNPAQITNLEGNINKERISNYSLILRKE